MNELITRIFSNFSVDGKSIPVKFLHYEGHGEPYVVWQKESMDRAFTADDALENYVDYYDFSIYSKGNYTKIVDAVKSLLKQNDFLWEVNRSSGDFYDPDSGYYYTTLNFSYLRSE